MTLETFKALVFQSCLEFNTTISSLRFQRHWFLFGTKKANKNFLTKFCHRKVRGSKREIIVASIEMNKDLSRCKEHLFFQLEFLKMVCRVLLSNKIFQLILFNPTQAVAPTFKLAWTRNFKIPRNFSDPSFINLLQGTFLLLCVFIDAHPNN